MSESNQNRIIAALEQAKQQGQLRTEKIKEIVRQAIQQSIQEEKEGRTEIRSLIQDTVLAVVETLQEKGGEVKEEIIASIEGVIEAFTSDRQGQISQNRQEIQELQSKLESEEIQLQQEIDGALIHVQNNSQDRSPKMKKAIIDAIESIRNSEEVSLLQKRYAQLKAQLSLVQADLATQYGGRYQDVKHHLDEAKTWYEKAKQDPAVFNDRVDRQRIEFEQKLSEAGTAIAQKERQLKQILKDLWNNLSEILQKKQ